MNSKKNPSRRDFLQKTSTGLLGAAVAPSLIPSRVLGANDRIRVALMGTNGRGSALMANFAKAKNCEIAYICDVDKQVIEKTQLKLKAVQEKKAKGIQDFRKALDDKNVDVLVVAAPDHWHAPATLMALKAGKHVYVEKPCGHNPREGELLIEAQKKYGKVVQMGNQQRSSVHTMEALALLKDGMLGRPYFAKAWYANTRGPIGTGKEVPVPEWLDYDLWQGPAPRVAYRDNVIHYNWHWFWRWGTGESCNNATHEVDVCRWALEAEYPIRALSSGGRYHYQDDWEFWDTQVMSFEFEGNKSLTWEGRSCNGTQPYGRGRGSAIHCTEGTVIIDRNGYEMFDNKGQKIKEWIGTENNSTLDTVGGEGAMEGHHIGNMLTVIREGGKQNSPIEEGHKSVLLCHLGNIAQETGRALEIDPKNGHIKNDAEAQKFWSRDYEPGWELKV